MNERICGRAILIKDEEVYLLYRRRKVKNEVIEYYAIPGGMKEANESIEECTIREIKEELNLEIELDKFLGIYENNGNKDYMYKATILGGDLRLGGEELEGNSPDNYYEIRKIKINELDNINIYEKNKEYIKKAIENDINNM